MARSFTDRKRFRKSFGSIAETAQLPNLIALQKVSYEQFLQYHVPHQQREKKGLLELFQSCFPIFDSSHKAQLEFHRYDFDPPQFSELECRQKGLTYAASLRVIFRLIVWDIDEVTKVKSMRDIKEQEVYFADVPLITDRGTFIINGIERVVVSQMHRSPGVFFDSDKGKGSVTGKILYVGRVVPYRGSWLDLEFDPKDIMHSRIDRRRRFLLTTFLMALDNYDGQSLKNKPSFYVSGANLKDAPTGMSRDEIVQTFYKIWSYKKVSDGFVFPFEHDYWDGQKITSDFLDPKTHTVLVENGTKLTQRLCKKLQEQGVSEFLIKDESLIGRYIGRDYINEETGQIYFEAGQEINNDILEKMKASSIDAFDLVIIDEKTTGPYLLKTLQMDKNQNREEALLDIYRTLRPGEPPTLESAEILFENLFFNEERYDLSSVGRVKFNASLNLKVDDTVRVLRKQDIVEMLKHLLKLRDGRGHVDDIDSLINRRVRSVGELLENQFRIGMARMERAIYERMGATDVNAAMPNDLLNAKPIAAALREFFGTSQLSQFMDQTNPLSEITHKRRLSALGPGGLSRDRASFEVRDVHHTHYGRICPIETPEGPNIGLINSLAIYANVNQYGFIETPYRKVVDGRVSDEIVYMNAREEGKHIIAQASISLDKDGNIKEDFVVCRKQGEVSMFPKQAVTYMDVSPKQVVSVAASLIPFLENDDANRALMGSNMQRQAVPLLKAEAPLVGTGMEAVVAKDSGASVIAKRSGIVDQVDAYRIVIKLSEEEDENKTGVDIYTLMKFKRSNMSTCINQRPLVKRGDVVKKGDMIADGPSIDTGELALGRNVRVAFMSWQGYNFEDSILISERLVQQDVFSSIHIEEFEVSARDTKLGNEEITKDIPNVTASALKYLDDAGIVYVGAEIKPGDILVGKVTPKGENIVTPEEKLLRAVFGEKSSDIKDTSLRASSGTYGTVVDVRVLSRKGVEKDERSIAIERQEIEVFAKNRDTEKAILQKSYLERMAKLLVGQAVQSGPKPLKAKMIITEEILTEIGYIHWKHIVLSDADKMKEMNQIQKSFDNSIATLDKNFENNVDKLKRGDDLPPGVLKVVKIFVAVKRKLQPGDKMAGRHGNKGVVSKIVPVEDLPYMEDGTPIDIILNPLGLPSRMNVGQILETHLGAAAFELGKQVQKMLDDYRSNNLDFEKAKERLGEIYDTPQDKKDIDALSESEFVDMSQRLTKGVPVATPVFNGASEKQISDLLEKVGLSRSGQVWLYDGRTGEQFDRQVTVGFIYMLKLHHLVDDKIHARSIGPYSLVTQQPLGGKAQFGGQRFGEMEVWALEGYGAAHTLQEMLTAKADDVTGRARAYDAIVRGEDNMEFGIPESFNVLVKELRSLGLDMQFEKKF